MRFKKASDVGCLGNPCQQAACALISSCLTKTALAWQYHTNALSDEKNRPALALHRHDTRCGDHTSQLVHAAATLMSMVTTLHRGAAPFLRLMCPTSVL